MNLTEFRQAVGALLPSPPDDDQWSWVHKHLGRAVMERAASQGAKGAAQVARMIEETRRTFGAKPDERDDPELAAEMRQSKVPGAVGERFAVPAELGDRQ